MTVATSRSPSRELRRPAILQHPVHSYAHDVVAGTIIAGPWVRALCEKHLKDVKTGRRRGLQFDEDRANHALEFFDWLSFENGEPFILQPFQVFIVGSLFGWMKGEHRRYRVAYIEMAKGNGKTPLGAGILLYLLISDGQPSPECYCAAATREQASVAFKDCKRMAEDSEDIKELVDILAHSLYVPDTRGVLRAVSSEGRGLDGKRNHGVLVDELHQHPTAVVADKMRAGTKRQLDALIVETTNSGVDRNSVCYAHHEKSINVLQGKVTDDAWFAYVCAVDQEDAQDDEGVFSLSRLAANRECWVKANPGLGTVLPLSYLEERVTDALGMPSRQSEVLRYNFCVWTDAITVWIPDEIWMACAVDRDLEAELEGEPCFAGLDLGRSRDLSALILLFPPSGTRIKAPPDSRKKWAFLEYLWCPEYDIRERSERDQVPYEQWYRDGHVIATPGNVIDFAWIKREALDLAAKYRAQEWAFDRHFATQLVTELGQEGFTMAPVGQGSISMHAPVTEIERLVYGKMIEHRGLPPMRWMMGNVALRKDAHGGVSIDKERSKEKVDGPQALADAMARAILTVQPEDISCRCAEPKPDEAGLCLACLKWTAQHEVATFL